MKVLEPGQNWKIAALRASFHVHFLFGCDFMDNYNDEFMNIAFLEADLAFDQDEVPVGCVIVKDGKIIAKAHNLKESDNCVLSHAEIKCISDSSSFLNNWRLIDCDVYITLDPCPMCASALKQARVRNIYSAIENMDQNNINIINQIFEADKNNSNINFYSNLAVDKSKHILKSFFEKQRNK